MGQLESALIDMAAVKAIIMAAMEKCIFSTRIDSWVRSTA